MNDDLADLLAPPPPAPLGDTFSASLSVLKTRARRRAVLRISGGVAALVLAAVLGWCAKPQPPQDVKETLVRAMETETPTPLVREDPYKLEIRAELATLPEEAAGFYRQAGDAYLARTDYAEAARCYKLFLSMGGTKVRDLVRGDSWLLGSIKTTYSSED